MLTPTTNPSNPETAVLPILQSHEKDIAASIPSTFSVPTNTSSSLFSDYLKTGNTMFKNAASSAFKDLQTTAGSILANNTQVTDNTPSATKLTVPQRGANYTQQELPTISGILYGELSNNGTPADQMNEAHKILDTAINRAKATGQTIGQVMTAPNQYQAYKSPQYWQYQIGTKQGGLDAPSQAKAVLVQKVVANLGTNAFSQDDTGNDYFYAHNAKGNLVLRSGALFAKDTPQ